MTCKTLKYWPVFIMFLLCFVPPIIFADEGDIVKAVTLCSDSVLVKLKNFGMVAIRKADVGEDMFQHLHSTALELFETGKKTGVFDPGYPIDVCGFENIMTITILEKNR